VRRHAIYQRYAELIDAMYDGASAVRARITHRYEDGSQQTLEVPVAIRNLGSPHSPPTSAVRPAAGSCRYLADCCSVPIASSNDGEARSQEAIP